MVKCEIQAVRPGDKFWQRFVDFYRPFMYTSSGPEGAMWIENEDKLRMLPRKGELWVGFGKPLCKKIAEAKRNGFQKVDLTEMFETLFPEQARECRRREKARDDAEVMVKKAFGVVKVTLGGDSMPKTQQMARDAGLQIAEMYGRYLTNAYIGNGQYAHYVVTDVGIDDYADAYVVTKGKRKDCDLVAYFNASRRIQKILPRCNYDFNTKLFRCWECGIEFTFFEINIADSLPAWKALDQRIEFAMDKYCGC